MSALNAIFIHGVGQQKFDFAHDARRWLRASMVARGRKCFFLSCHWAPFADKLQAEFLKRTMQHGSKGNLTQRLTIGTLADALAYARNPELRARIHDHLDRQVMAFKGQPFTVFAHSLGGLIATDWLRGRPKLRDVRLVTLACNIGIFDLGQKFVPPAQLLRPNRWINCFDDADMLGFPLNIDGSMRYVHDVEVEVGSWWNRWNGLVHIGYFTDERLWSKTLPFLLDP